MKLSKHFNREEFACSCGCGFDTVDSYLLEVLEDVRHHFDAPVIINSACRCSVHNYTVGGKATSQHLFGRAADIVVKGYDPVEVYTYLAHRFPHELGLGRYETFTHVDTRNGKGRWNG